MLTITRKLNRRCF
uniref:Uncharacterized protein n=1 Tax=Rhizophora mucronata TaxID=61149 RepID=A0A2P2M160_RHIMU